MKTFQFNQCVGSHEGPWKSGSRFVLVFFTTVINAF